MNNKRDVDNEAVAIERKNLAYVCRLSVKTLVEKSCFGHADEQGKEVQNFLVILEHVLSHRLKAFQTWYGAEEPRSFWEFIYLACRGLPHNNLNSIKSLEYPKSGRGKARAWLRLALMEKRLSDYLTAALEHSRLARRFYMEGSIMLAEDANIIAGLLLGLNSIDFSFDIRGENLDYAIKLPINYTPYLKFEHRPDDDIFEDGPSGEWARSEGEESWRDKYCQLEDQQKILSEQKAYLDELSRLRESQLEESQSQRDHLAESLLNHRNDSRRERHQLEGVILELQEQLRTVNDAHMYDVQQLQGLLAKSKTEAPVINLAEITVQAEPQPQTRSSTVTQPHEDSPSSYLTASPSPRVDRKSSDLQSTTSCDTKSIASSTSVFYNVADKDSQSLIVMAGSLSSQTSKLSAGDMPAQTLTSPENKEREQTLTADLQESEKKEHQKTDEKTTRDSQTSDFESSERAKVEIGEGDE